MRIKILNVLFRIKVVCTSSCTWVDPNLLVIVVDFFPKNGKFFTLNDGSKRYFERVKYKCENYQDGIHRYIMGEDGGFSTFKDVYSYLFPGYTFKFEYFYPIQEDEDEICPNIVIGLGQKEDEDENENVILLCDHDCLLELMSEWEEDPGFRNCCCKKYPVFDDDKFIDDWTLRFICKSAFHSKNPKEDLKLLCDSGNCDLFDFENEGFYSKHVLKKYKKDIDQLVLKILDFKT